MGLNREQQLKRNEQLKQVIEPDCRLLEACEALRYDVEHQGKDFDIMIGQGIYRKKNPDAIMTVQVDGVVIGYKIKECSPLVINPYFDRYCFVRFPNHRLQDLSDKELATVKFTCLEAFFEPQQGEVHHEVIGQGAILMWQRFQVAFAHKFQDATTFVPGSFNA